MRVSRVLWICRVRVGLHLENDNGRNREGLEVFPQNQKQLLDQVLHHQLDVHLSVVTCPAVMVNL